MLSVDRNQNVAVGLINALVGVSLLRSTTDGWVALVYSEYSLRIHLAMVDSCMLVVPS